MDYSGFRASCHVMNGLDERPNFSSRTELIETWEIITSNSLNDIQSKVHSSQTTHLTCITNTCLLVVIRDVFLFILRTVWYMEINNYFFRYTGDRREAGTAEGDNKEGKWNLLTHGAEPFLSCQLCSHSRTFQHFMEPEGSLPCSQDSSTGPYHKPDKSNPYHLILSRIHFNIVDPSTSWFP
jgi:hypothetical protein